MYCRYLCFKSPEEFKETLVSRTPHKIDIGAVFNIPPKNHLSTEKRVFVPISKENDKVVVLRWSLISIWPTMIQCAHVARVQRCALSAGLSWCAQPTCLTWLWHRTLDSKQCYGSSLEEEVSIVGLQTKKQGQWAMRCVQQSQSTFIFQLEMRSVQDLSWLTHFTQHLIEPSSF